MTKLSTLLALSLVVATAACAAPSEETGTESEETGTTSEALTACSPGITAAAITKQIVSVEEPITLTVELVTISKKPFSYQAQSLTFPAGFVQNSLGTTSCTDTGTGSWRCRHEAQLLAVGAMSGTGAYSMTLAAKADAGSGCTGGATQRIDFSLQTEWFGYYDVDGSGMAGVAIYGASEYGGWAYRFDEPGAYSFTGKWAGLNDQLSSVHVDRGWKITLYEHANFTGRTKVITADTSFVGWDFNDLTSAIVVSRL